MRWGIATVLAAAALGLAYALGPSDAAWKQASTWQSFASPGALSVAHAHLENNCSSCHSPVSGVDSAKCVLCHANDSSLLQRQPTAFHAHVSNCSSCHVEHQGAAAYLSVMDHDVLAGLGLAALEDADEGAWIGLEAHMEAHSGAPRALGLEASLTPREALLDCSTCHSNEDPHFGLMGRDCAQCHGTQMWTIPVFRHPSSKSRDCAQCHQAPPSHYMMHFNMVSAKVARKPHAKVEQCFECHRTTAWTDIPGIGHYKHH